LAKTASYEPLSLTIGPAVSPGRHDKNTKQEAQLPQRNSTWAAHMEGARPSSPLPVSPLWPLHLYAYGRIRNPQQKYVKHAVRKAHFKLNGAFKVIQGHPYLCPAGMQNGVLS